jgi:hypothetical protein
MSSDETGVRGIGEDGLLHGKVAALVNVRQLAINLGSKQGVTEGMEFDVMNRSAGEIRDPDTHEVLGSITLSKLQIKIILVADEFSVGAVQGMRPSAGFGLPDWLYTSSASRPLTLKRSEHPDVEEIEEKDSIVKVGDPVVQVKSTA